MPTILSFSSQVARGHIGHSANQFVWQRLGIDVIALPTILLSNRPDYPHRAGERVRPELLEEMIGALNANGWLRRVDAVFTGYLPSAAHVELAARLVEHLKTDRPGGLIYCCDPILGDEPDGLYIAEDAALALREKLLPLADLVTPNRFELGWLTGRDIASREDALAAAEGLGRMVLATSTPGNGDAALANLLVFGGRACQTQVSHREAVPHGTGDFMASLFLAYLLQPHRPEDALALATGGMEAVIGISEGAEELALIASQDRWAQATPWPVTMLEAERA